MIINKYFYYLISIFNLLFGIREVILIIRIFLGIAPQNLYKIHLRKAGVVFTVRSPMDVWSIKETFLDRFYERYGTALKDGWRIIDIGAGIGDFTLYSAIGFPNSSIYAFEPFPESFQLLKTNIKSNNAENVKLFPQAVGGTTGMMSLYLSEREPLKIRSGENLDLSRSDNKILVPSLSLSDAFEKLIIEKCDLLKLDCEGAEYPILFNAPENIINLVDRIIMEYHDHIVEYQHGDLVAFLKSNGYKVKTYPNQVHAYLGYLYAYR